MSETEDGAILTDLQIVVIRCLSSVVSESDVIWRYAQDYQGNFDDCLEGVFDVVADLINKRVPGLAIYDLNAYRRYHDFIVKQYQQKTQ